MFVEVRSDCRGAAIELRALAELDVLDCQREPWLLTELEQRFADPAGFQYRTEPVDVWTSWAVEAWRKRRLADPTHRRRWRASTICGGAERGPIRCDCEEFASLAAAFAHLKGAYQVFLCVTQPREHGVAHAYDVVQWTPAGPPTLYDLAVVYGMREPPASFYLGPETAAFELRAPEPAIWLPRP